MRTSIKYLICSIGSAGNPLTVYCEHSSREAALDELRKREKTLAELDELRKWEKALAVPEPKLKSWDHPFYIFEVIKTESD